MKEKILIVDDDPNILDGYKRSLRKQFKIETAVGGEAGLDMLKKAGPYGVIVSDMRMPDMDGTKFLTYAREHYPESVRILLTGQAGMEETISVINKGHIFRFLTKPCSVEDFSRALNDGLEYFNLIKSEKELLNKTLQGIIKLIVDMMSLVNPDTFSRSVRIRKIAHKVATRLNMENLWQVDIAALLSQIGCLTIPGDILSKKYQGQPLSDDEVDLFNKRLTIGKDLIANIPRLEEIAEAIAYQEKKFDGGGYPRDDVRGKDIPLIARILYAVHQYDDLLTAEYTQKDAVKQMAVHSVWYDPDVLAALNAEAANVEKGFIIREIPANEIKVGMILADDIKTKTNLMLVAKHQEISNTLHVCIANFASKNNLVEPIKILDCVTKKVPVQPEQPFLRQVQDGI